MLGTLFDPHPATPGLDRLRRTSTGYAGRGTSTSYAGPGRRGARSTVIRPIERDCPKNQPLSAQLFRNMRAPLVRPSFFVTDFCTSRDVQKCVTSHSFFVTCEHRPPPVRAPVDCPPTARVRPGRPCALRLPVRERPCPCGRQAIFRNMRAPATACPRPGRLPSDYPCPPRSTD